MRYIIFIIFILTTLSKISNAQEMNENEIDIFSLGFGIETGYNICSDDMKQYNLEKSSGQYEATLYCNLGCHLFMDIFPL
ncbi:MAG: hypothetical protein SVZ03_11695 [Spirochaetota bacterium]|nr:hypothetical protein [Spirochaetota bacterium]